MNRAKLEEILEQHGLVRENDCENPKAGQVLWIGRSKQIAFNATVFVLLGEEDDGFAIVGSRTREDPGTKVDYDKAVWLVGQWARGTEARPEQPDYDSLEIFAASKMMPHGTAPLGEETVFGDVPEEMFSERSDSLRPTLGNIHHVLMGLDAESRALPLYRFTNGPEHIVAYDALDAHDIWVAHHHREYSDADAKAQVWTKLEWEPGMEQERGYGDT